MALKITYSLRGVSNNSKEQELGFGKNLTTTSRMMNPDGAFNVRRQPITPYDNSYFGLITMPWWQFFALVFAGYIVLNFLFASVYLIIGVDSLTGMEKGPFWSNFYEAFFFSTQTLTTVGYGRVNPIGLASNIVAAIESFSGLVAFALISGLLYGRFSRPKAKIVFSEHILVAPFRDGKALMFRMANARRSELIETEAKMSVAINQMDTDGNLARTFFPLNLQLNRIAFFSLSWTLVHVLDENSPLAGFTENDLKEGNAEFLVLVQGIDETNHSMVHARHSYYGDEIVWNARFAPVIGKDKQGIPMVMTSKVGAFEYLLQPIAQPAPAEASNS